MSAQELPTIESILEFMRQSAKDSDERHRKYDEEAKERRREADERHRKYEAEAEVRRREADERHRKYEAEAEVRRQEAEVRRREADERHRKYEAEAEERRREHEEFRRKSDEEAKERRRKADEEFARLHAETEEVRKKAEASYNRANEIVGRLGNRVGDVIEQLVIPNINEKFEAFGFDFVSVAPNVTWKIKGKVAVEVDVFLTNGDAVMAIEVKTHLTKDDVLYHLQRLDKLRARATEFGLTTKKIYGSVTAPLIDPEARDLALSSGLYLIEQPDEKDLKIIAPSGKFSPRAW